MNQQLSIPREQLVDFCRRWSVTELALFGSALREDFRPDSDVDVLVSFSEDAHHSLFDMVRMQKELEQILGRQVDLVSRRAIEMSRNNIRRNVILRSAGAVYAS